MSVKHRELGNVHDFEFPLLTARPMDTSPGDYFLKLSGFSKH